MKLSSLSLIMWVIRRDLRVANRQRSEWLNPLIFLLMVITLFPLGVGPGEQILSRIAPGIIWVAALLSGLLGLDRLLREDYEDGSLEQLVLQPVSLSMTGLGKIVAHWLLSGLPLVILAPLFGLLLSVPVSAWWVLTLSLLLGTPMISALGAIGAALTLQARRSGTLVSLILLPLLIPLLIFATSAIEAAAMGLPANGQLAIIAAMSVLALTLSPLAMAAAIRMSIR
ncbi:heme exporter protein CcmB [Idiomarina tyrosinivorans]|uniref:Heme exporter protein B n=1 Tax=Idiomarina tyrosinivorans TaxID=1445662 RepID=A0A432ZPH1_9GAMM|nr:heme exporter protein CcmB [Idiomarina tyrosinivorans]RUO79794.1 heme exporter protein CcmB [Idiomarina tyrosinivorans]